MQCCTAAVTFFQLLASNHVEFFSYCNLTIRCRFVPHLSNHVALHTLVHLISLLFTVLGTSPLIVSFNCPFLGHIFLELCRTSLVTVFFFSVFSTVLMQSACYTVSNLRRPLRNDFLQVFSVNFRRICRFHACLNYFSVLEQ